MLLWLDLFSRPGFQIHTDKSQFKPTREIVFLGFMINSRTMKVSLNYPKQNKKLLHYVASF